MRQLEKLIGKKVKLYKADEEGKPTEDVVLQGTFQGLAREVFVNGSFCTSFDMALVFDGKALHKVYIEQLSFS